MTRRFDNLQDGEQSEDLYYGSDDWRKAPREPLLALIEGCVDAVTEVDEAVVEGLRTARS